MHWLRKFLSPGAHLATAAGMLLAVVWIAVEPNYWTRVVLIAPAMALYTATVYLYCRKLAK